MVHPVDENQLETEHDGISDLETIFREFNSGIHCGRFRYGGPRQANAKIIEKASLVKQPATDNKVFNLGWDVLFLLFQYMNAVDLKNMALVCKKISQHTLRYMHMHLTQHPPTCNANAYDSSRMTFTCETFERLYGETLLPKLQEITIAPLRMEDLQGILSKARSLERMNIILPARNIMRSYDGLVQGMQQLGRNHVLARTVGQQLKELYIYYGLSHDAWPLTIPCLDDRDLWPELKVVQYENIWDPITGRESDPICGRINLLTENEWTRFLMEFLPKCENMTEFRLHWKGMGGDTNFPLRTFAQQLADLCRDFQLRALDIDASALMKPPNHPYVFNDEELCTVNKHLSWINVPERLPGYSSSDKLMLLNLRELTLRNLFIHSKAEFEWFMSLTTLKKLEKLRIDRLVWHHGYHRWANVYGWMYQISDEGNEEDPKNYDSRCDKGYRKPPTWDEKSWDGDDSKSIYYVAERLYKWKDVGIANTDGIDSIFV
ncbi:hypothetical protein BZA77DRAFT_294804 [Pyronema omphalodes]|nr:hypothetical protein BZA77DRAFT_294804 [Pyronema omphalodes]